MMKKAAPIRASDDAVQHKPRKHAPKKGGTKRLEAPDFLANLKRLGYPKSVGDSLLLKFNDSLS